MISGSQGEAGVFGLFIEVGEVCSAARFPRRHSGSLTVGSGIQPSQTFAHLRVEDGPTSRCIASYTGRIKLVHYLTNNELTDFEWAILE